MMHLDILIWIVLFSLFFLGVPVFASLGMATAFVLFFSDIPLSTIPLELYQITGMFPLLAIPGFILAGSLMERGGMADEIVDVAYALIGRVRGGLGIVTILACMFFAAMIGSGGGTVAAVGTLLIPSMVQRGYGKDYASAVCATGGTMGILIPPSNPMIVYAVIANISVADMFLAGFIPGLVVGICLMVTAYLMARKRGIQGSGEKFVLKDFLKLIWHGKWSLSAPLIILGGIYSGICTPVEASVIAIVYSLIVGSFVTKKLNLSRIWESITLTNVSSSVILVVVGVSMLFGRFLTMLQVPQSISQMMLGITNNPSIILLLIIGFLLIVGMFMETLSTILIVTPIFLPLLTQLGVDPLIFGILLVMTNEIAMLTPPLGLNLFIVTKLTDIELEKVAVAVIPFVLTLIVCVVLLTVVAPEVVLYLPKVLGH